MERNIKTELDEFVPLHITLYEDEKNTIVREAKQRVTYGKRKSFSFKPAFISIAMLFIIGFFITPAIQEEFLTSSPLTPQKVTIEGVEYARLVSSFYIDTTSEIVYSDQYGIYSYNTESFETSTLFKPVDNEVIYEVVANDQWLIWLELSSKSLNILDRKTSERTIINDFMMPYLLLEGDTLFYMQLNGELEDVYSFYKLNLNTLEETVLHKMGHEGSNSMPIIAEGKLLISEYQKAEDGHQVTTFFVYDINTNERIANFTVPYELAVDVTLSDNKIYATLLNDGDYTILGSINLTDGKFTEIETPIFEMSAVHGNYVALSIPVEDSNTVKLYQLEDNGLVPLSTFNHIKERLVKPRFTNEGTLVVNGEGPDRSMYLVKTIE